MKKVIYKVLENDRDCTSKARGRVPGNGWDNCEFQTLEEALEYAKSWLGEYAATIPPNWNGASYDFSGYGDKIEIKKID